MKTLNGIFDFIIPMLTFLIPLGELLFKEDRKIFRRVTNLGWGCLVLAIFMGANTLISKAVIADDKDKADSAYNSTIHKLQYSLDTANGELKNIKKELNKLGLSIQKSASGHTIIVNEARGASNTVICPIEVYLTTHPTKKMQTLCNGDKIQSEYRTNKDSVTFTIPYMKGKDFAGGFTMDNISLAPVKFDKSTGTFDVRTAGTGGWLNETRIVFSANVPAKQLEK